MLRRTLTLSLCLICTGAVADEYKIIKLEQDVRNLERQVQNLSREIADLRSRWSRSGETLPAPGAPRREFMSTEWLSLANWQRVRPGMNELEVINTLGPPTSMRLEDDARVLLYAMEIGANSFLSGSVTMKDRQVTQVDKPVLK